MNAETQTTMEKVRIDWMIRRDMAAVLQIEAESFPDHPWTEQDFVNCLRHRNRIGMMARIGSGTVGFMIYELDKQRIDVLNFAVAADCRRRGVGRQMVAKLAAIRQAEQERREFASRVFTQMFWSTNPEPRPVVVQKEGDSDGF